MQERQDAMNQYFSLLGLQEDAGKDDVKAAYMRRVQKYKASDYDDDPEYVRKKLAELKTAYEQAYRMAGSGSSSAYRRDDFDRPASSQEKVLDSPVTRSSSLQAHRKLHDQEEKETRQKRIRRLQENESRKDRIEAEEEGSLFRKPDLSALRQKAESLRDEIKSQTDDLKETVSKASDKTGGTIMDLPDGTGKTSRTGKSGQTGRTKRFGSADTESASRHIKFFGVIIIVIISLISGTGQCSYEDDYDDYDDSTDYSYEYSYISDEDQVIFDTAIDCNDLLFDTGYASSYTVSGYDSDALQTQADKFAQNYLDMTGLSEVLAYLYDNYGEFYITSEEPLETQITEVLKFYGFLEPDSAEGYIDPYSDETITSIYAYMVYINEYFEKSDLTEDDGDD